MPSAFPLWGRADSVGPSGGPGTQDGPAWLASAIAGGYRQKRNAASCVPVVVMRRPRTGRCFTPLTLSSPAACRSGGSFGRADCQWPARLSPPRILDFLPGFTSSYAALALGAMDHPFLAGREPTRSTTSPPHRWKLRDCPPNGGDEGIIPQLLGMLEEKFLLPLGRDSTK